MSNYYVIGANKKDARAEILNIPTQNGTSIIFPDISDVDLATTQIKRENFREAMAMANEDFKPERDSIVIAQYPYKKNQSKLYYNIPNGNNPRAEGYINALRDFAQERSEKHAAGEKMTLEKDFPFRDLVDRLLFEITYLPNAMSVISDDSLVIEYLKTRINRIVNTISEGDRFYTRSRVEEKLRDYKALRSLVLEISLLLDQENVFIRKNLQRLSTEQKGIFIADQFITDTIEKPWENHQMTIDEYMALRKK